MYPALWTRYKWIKCFEKLSISEHEIAHDDINASLSVICIYYFMYNVRTHFANKNACLREINRIKKNMKVKTTSLNNLLFIIITVDITHLLPSERKEQSFETSISSPFQHSKMNDEWFNGKQPTSDDLVYVLILLKKKKSLDFSQGHFSFRMNWNCWGVWAHNPQHHIYDGMTSFTFCNLFIRFICFCLNRKWNTGRSYNNNG